MKILVACEESQAVTKELRRLGHEAYSCDIIDQSGGHPEWHIMQDVLPLLNGRCEFRTTDGAKHVIPERWDMLIAFPPCTHLAGSGARHFEAKRADGRQREGIEFFCQFLTADCDRIVIENPVGIISGDYILQWFPDLAEKYNLPRKPSQIIQPYEFGDPAKKSTCLWLIGVAPLKPTNIVTPELVSYKCKNGKTATFSKHYVQGFSNGERAQHRSKTFPGIALAIAWQMAGPCEESEETQPEEEPTDLSDAPEEIKEEIMNNAEQLEKREGAEVKPATVHDFNAAAQLKKLADERKALANINPDSARFADDIRALEYAINVLEVVGL